MRKEETFVLISFVSTRPFLEIDPARAEKVLLLRRTSQKPLEMSQDAAHATGRQNLACRGERGDKRECQGKEQKRKGERLVPTCLR